MFDKVASIIQTDFGDPDLPCQVRVALGDVSVTVRMAVPAWADFLRDRYRSFPGSAKEEWVCDVVSSAAVVPEQFRSIETASVGGRHYVARHDFWVEHDPRFSRVRAFMVENASPLSVDAVVRITFAFAAIRSGGFLTHAAGIVRDGQGFLFPGITGRGKSSLCGQFPADEVLSDEIVLLQPHEGRFVIRGTPFWGSGGQQRNAAAPLEDILFPMRAERTGISPAPPIRALPLLLGAVISFAGDPGTASHLLNLAARIVAERRCRILEIGPEPASARRCFDLWAGGNRDDPP